MSLFSAHWFDAVLVAAIIFGVYRGRKTGAMPQIFGFCNWTLMLVICSFLYAAPAQWLGKLCHMQPDVMGLIIYPIELAVVGSALGFMLYRFEHTMVRKEAFGRCETYVAMLAGAARVFVILLTATAWLSGRYVTAKDLRDYEKYCDDNYGGVRLPAISTIHNDVFDGSFSGRFVKAFLKPVLMEAPPRIDYGDRPKSEPAGKGKVRPKEDDLGDGNTNANIGPATGNLKNQKDIPQGPEGSATVAGSSKDPQAAKTPETIGTTKIIYHNLTLRGIFVASQKRVALINNQSFHEGESAEVNMEARQVKLHCLRIMDDAVNVQVEEKTNVITLRMGKMTDLDGRLVPPPGH